MDKNIIYYADSEIPDSIPMLDNDILLSLKNRKGNTPLLIIFQHFATMDRSNNFPPDYQEDNIWYKMMFKTLRLLIYQGAEVNQANNDGITPLMLAPQKMLFFLLQHGANALAKDKNGTTVAMYHAGDLRTLRRLAEYGADLKVKNHFGDDVLLLCEAKYHILRYLIGECGFSVNDMNKRQETILHKACESGNKLAVKYLMERGADQTIQNAQGNTPYMELLEKSFNEDTDKYDYKIMQYLNKLSRRTNPAILKS